MYKRQEIDINFLGGERHNYFIVPYEKLNIAHEYPGIYSWHIRPISESDIECYDEFFNQLNMTVHVSGNMRLNYKGIINKVKDNISTELDINLFGDVAISIAYPIYIGISHNVKSRLIKHRKQFEESLMKKKEPSDNAPSVESDTDEESSYFGGRLASIWPEKLPQHCLFVKYVIPRLCLENKCSNGCNTTGCRAEIYSQLRLSETICNSLFNPVFGRK